MHVLSLKNKILSDCYRNGMQNSRWRLCYSIYYKKMVCRTVERDCAIVFTAKNSVQNTEQ